MPHSRGRMVFVDFSNAYLREFLAADYLAVHETQLEKVRACIPAKVQTVLQQADFKERPQPLAAVLDIDEIILANIHMNTYFGEGQLPFYACDYYSTPEGRPWPRDDTRLNPLLPGARELIAAFVEQGVEVFFITGRAESLRAETVENFEYVGLSGDATADKSYLFDSRKLLDPSSGKLAMCPDTELPAAGESIRPFKESRRALLARTHRIVMNIGDQVSDLGFYGDWHILVPHQFYRTR